MPSNGITFVYARSQGKKFAETVNPTCEPIRLRRPNVHLITGLARGSFASERFDTTPDIIGSNLCHRMRPLLIHYHIFKNAGTSFECALRKALGPRLRTYDSPVPQGILSADDIINYVTSAPEIEAICTHQAILPGPKIRDRAVFTSILIRDPIARIRSIYAFEQRQREPTPGALKAKAADFKGYVEWRLGTTPAMLCNFQTYFCSRTKTAVHNKAVNEIHLQEAIANLDRINIVGTVERYGDWLRLAQAILSKAFQNISLSASRQNATRAEPEVTHAEIFDDLVSDLGLGLAEHLLECNKLDMRLHQIADALLSRKLAEEGVTIALREAYAKAATRLSTKSLSDANFRKAN